MPLDRTEDFFKKKLAELDQTLPPEVTWNKAQGWRQLRPELTVKRRPANIWYQVAAAVTVIIASVLFISNLKSKNATIHSSKPIIAEHKPTPLLNPQSLMYRVKSIDSQTLKAIAASKPQVLKNIKKQVKEDSVVAYKPVNLPAKEPSSALSQRIIPTETDTPATPLKITPEPAPVGQTPVKITVVLGGKTNRQIANFAAGKADRKKSIRLKVQVNLPPPERLEDAAFTAKANSLLNRSVLSAQIDL